MGSGTSRSIVETSDPIVTNAGQDENSSTDTESSEPSTSHLNLSEPQPMSEACHQRTVTQDFVLEEYRMPEEKEIPTVNDILKVNSMVEQLLPHLEKDTISSISDSICEFAGDAVLECDEHSRSIVFAYDKNKLSISVDTVLQLVEDEDGCLLEVDLSLPQKERPDLRGKSRKKILDILATGGGEDHANLIECLTRWDIEHIVSPYTKNIFVKKFTGETISILGELINELQIDLSISGGGPCEYIMNSAEQTQLLPSATSKQDYRQKIAATQDYQQKIANSHSHLTLVRDRRIKIGVIDTGCSLSLYEQLSARKNVVLRNGMFSAVDASSRAIETNYEDCFVKHKPYKMIGHGTGVVEIIANCVLSGTKIYVANTGYPFGVSNIECAMMELFRRNVDILNCSFTVDGRSKHLASTLEIITSAIAGVIVVAAAGNDETKYFIESGLEDDGRTIFVGSHNDENSISKFSTGQCKANICSRGDGVYIANVEPNLCRGTSLATPNVTAAVANVLSHLPSLVVDLKRNIQSSAQGLKCGCNQHKGKEVSLKLHPEEFMNASFRDVDISKPDGVRSNLCCCFKNPCNNRPITMEKMLTSY